MARRPSPELVERRRESVPRITYPEQLPISERREEISDAIRDHQVVIVAGETGSGKTTQLPKICLELGPRRRGHDRPHPAPPAGGPHGRRAHRRGARHVELGEAVGYTVRFTDQVGDRTLVKLMTDGILLAEIQRDRMLRAYDTIIIDEAHERSLNIDFLLGYLAQLLPKRPDLKVIVTSATIETERFSEHFGGAPVIEVTGRTYPVEIRYRPLDEQGGDQIAGIADAVEELRRAGPGDVLVFLSGEREIRDTADALRALDLPDTEMLPLYARLSTAEQQRVFQPHPGRRVVLATNVAETSLTVPGIRYVVDPGTARISRYSQRLKVQRLPIEAISQASANQRAGRCGRVRRRHLHPPLRRGGLRRPARVHRPRDPAHQPGVGHPPDDGASASATSRRSRSSTRPTAGRSPTACACSRSSARSSRASAASPPLGRRLARLPDRPALRAHGARGRASRAACARC